MPKYYKYIKIILIALPVFLLFFLLNKQYPINGKLEMNYDFNKPHPFIGKMMPDNQVSQIQKIGKDYFQVAKTGSVYFDIELPANYQEAQVKLVYKTKNQSEIEVGGLVSDNPLIVNKKTLQKYLHVLDNDWQNGSKVLNMSNWRKDSKNRIRLIISASNQDNEEIQISNLKMILKTDPLLIKIKKNFCKSKRNPEEFLVKRSKDTL